MSDDYAKHFITDVETYKKMVLYLRSLNTAPIEDVVKDDEYLELTSFYGHTLTISDCREEKI